MKKVADAWYFCETFRHVNIDQLRNRILRRFPAFYAELVLTESCGSRLAEVLQGKTNPLSLIFSENSSIAEHLYQDAPSFKFYNLLVAKVTSHALERLPEGRRVRPLEIGGGTGGMTSYVSSVLPPDQSEYVFTDASFIFLDKAEQKFRSKPFLKYQLLDIEKDPVEQGFEANSFDVILASDVLHATVDLRASLGNVRKLLSSEGLLVLLETDNPTRWVDLVFGLTDGWWRFSDRDLRPTSPLLSRNRWVRLLAESGFSSPMAFSEIDRLDEASQAVFVARGPSIAEHANTQQGEGSAVQNGRRWLVFEDRRGVGRSVAERFERDGGKVVFITPGSAYRRVSDRSFEVSPDRPEEFRQALQDIVRPQTRLDAVIHCWSLDAPPAEYDADSWVQAAATLGCHSVMHFVQAWSGGAGADPPALCLVTAGIQPVGDINGLAVEQSPQLGLGRVIVNEHQEFRCKMVDLSWQLSTTEIDGLYTEIVGGDDENEVALRGPIRFVPRLTRCPAGDSSKAHSRLAAPGAGRYRVEIASPGVLDNLLLREQPPRKPGRGEVEIQVAAAGLNFRDVMKALGIYPAEGDGDLLLGDECAGTIVEAGEDVKGLHIGDEVVAIAAGCLASSVIARAEFVMLKPAEFSFEEAVTIPVAFLTAYYALHHLGRVCAGERVLIHAATGGVGLAAVQIARQAGAEVFATAGAPEKRSFLRSLGVRHVMDSRRLSFVDEIRELTAGKGVDIVLNSLAGEAIPQGLSCLAPYGRFLEIGKRDIYLNSKLGLRCFKNNLSFLATDLSRVMADRPTLVNHRSPVRYLSAEQEAGSPPQSMKRFFVDTCDSLHENYRGMIAHFEGDHVACDVGLLCEPHDITLLLSNGLFSEVSKAALRLIGRVKKRPATGKVRRDQSQVGQAPDVAGIPLGVGAVFLRTSEDRRAAWEG